MSVADGKLRAARLTCSEAAWERDRAERDAQWKRWMDCYAALDGIADPAEQVARWRRIEAALPKLQAAIRSAIGALNREAENYRDDTEPSSKADYQPAALALHECSDALRAALDEVTR